MRGIDYQPGGDAGRIDPLADKDICERDIEWFKDLGVNAIRVYTVDNSADHKDCMNALADAGIYLVVDVNNAMYSINRADPNLSYNAAYLQSIFATVSEFAQYKNTLAFFSGNEVISKLNETNNAPYLKAVTRDLRAYIKAQNLRSIPVGYSAADVDNRLETAHYMNCGPDEVRSDFFAFNDYSWCNSDFKTSRWDEKVKNFTDYGVPLFLSEYGCNENTPRKFDELSALMSDKMSSVYSGGIMYEYSYEESKYGIVKFSGEKGQGKVSKVGDGKEYDNFKDALKNYPAPKGDGGASKQSKASECPPKSAANWGVDPKSIPAMPKEAEKYMKEGAGTGPGLKGKGSQTAGDSGLSTSNVTLDGSGNSTTDKDNSSPMTGSSMMATVASVAVALIGTMLL